MKRFLLFLLSLFTVFTGFAATETWEKVTSTPTTWDGDYLIVYETDGVAFNGSITKLDVVSNTQNVTITDGKIETTDCNFYFTIATVEGGYSIKSASGYYIGRTASKNGMDTSTSTVYSNAISITDGNTSIKSNNLALQYNSTSGQTRFRYFSSTQKSIQLYKKVTSTDPDPEPTTGKKIFFNNRESAWNAVNVYAFKADGSKSNAAWPGEAATYNPSTGLYEYTVGNDYDKILFNDGSSKTEDLPVIEGKTYSKNSTGPETLYIVGNFDGNASWKPNDGRELTKSADYIFTIDNVYLDANDDNGYYTFARKLTETDTDDDWNTFNDNSNIFKGGSGNGDVETAAGNSYPIYGGNGQNWKIPAGAYKFTVDPIAATFKVEAASTQHVKSLGEVLQLTDDTKVKVMSPAVAVAQQGNNLWIKDDANWMLVYGNLNDKTYTNGDVIPAGYGGTKTTFSGLPELKEPTGFTKLEEKVDAVMPRKITAEALQNCLLNEYVELTGNVEGSGRDFTLTDDTGTAAIHTSSANITVTTGEKVVVRGFVSIFNKQRQITPVESEVITNTKVATPTFSIESGTAVEKGSTVAITTDTEGATIHYTIDGTEPTSTSTICNEPIILTEDVTIKAIAVKEGYDDSDVATATYTIATEPEPEDKIYMLGDIPGAIWDPSSAKAPLVKNTEGKYVIDEVTISNAGNGNGYGYFCFVDQLGANGKDWSANNGHRYGPETDGTEVTVGQTTAMIKYDWTDTAWKIPAGTYKMVVDIDAMTFVATAVTPTVVYPEKMYIFSNVSTNGGFKAGTGIEMTKVEDGIFRIDHVTVDEVGVILFSSDNTGDYYKYAYGATDENDIYITNLPATKTLVKQDLVNPNTFKTAPGKYNIVVNLINNTMYIEQMTWPENIYVLGNISKHHWKPDYTGAKMIMENDGKYHINGVKFELSGREEVAYFCLSTKASTVWQEVNDKQYGAVADNTPIVNEVETQVMKGINNWTLEPGIYDITFDFENLKISVKANSETNTIYYKPKADEQKVYLYAYKSSEPVTRSGNVANAEWPGEPIIVADKKDNTGFIRCEVNNKYDKVEFNDGTNHGPAIDNVADRNYSSGIYLIDNMTAEGWKPNVCRQLIQKTDNDKVIYQIPELIVAEKAGGQKNYFYLTATPAETEDDWETLNAGSFGAPEGNQTLVTDGKTPNPVVLGSNFGWEIPAGKYEVKFKPAENVLIVTDLNTVGIENVDADAAGAEYYNIQGIRMNKSQKGLNIIRRNGKTYKTAIR